MSTNRFALRRLGRTGIRATEIGLGCASLGLPDRSDADAVRGIRLAIERGINYVDTSPGYGESERRLGLALQDGWRGKVYLQTKVGTHPARRGDYTAAGTRWSVENSLRLLRTDCLDAVLIHDPADVGVPLSPGFALDELLKMKEQGLIRYVGIGCREHEFHRRAIETGLMDIVLTFLDYTLLDQSAAQTTLPLARRYDVGVQLASVFGCWAGTLAGQEPKDDPRAHAMWSWCRERGLSLRHLALHFALAAPISGIVLVGCGTPRHIDEVCREALEPVPAAVWQDFRAEFGVGVCQPLPQGEREGVKA
jgi:aryl-alcohol dehydrogenase-like predicted oxidoreductase